MDLRQFRRGCRDQSGAALIVGVIALLLLGVALVAGMRFVGAKVTLADQQATARQTTAIIQKALWVFAAKNYRLPCPASGAAASQSATDGVERTSGGACTITDNSGVVPWKSLGINYTDALDGWGRRIGYAVSASAASPLATPYQSSVPSGDSIQVSICSSAGNGTCATPSTTNAYAYALISYGTDGAGAYLPSGKRAAPPAASTNESENASAAGFNGAGFFIFPFSNSTATAAYYDDWLVYETSTQVCNDLNGKTGSAYCNSGGGGGGPPPPPWDKVLANSVPILQDIANNDKTQVSPNGGTGQMKEDISFIYNGNTYTGWGIASGGSNKDINNNQYVDINFNSLCSTQVAIGIYFNGNVNSLTNYATVTGYSAWTTNNGGTLGHSVDTSTLEAPIAGFNLCMTGTSSSIPCSATNGNDGWVNSNFVITFPQKVCAIRIAAPGTSDFIITSVTYQ